MGLGREGDRDLEDDAEDPVLAKDLPEGNGLAEHPDDRLAGRDPQRADFDRPGGGADLGRGEGGEVGLRVAAEEVEDVVFPRVDPGHKVRPGDRRDRGVAGPQGAEGPLLFQGGEVGQELPVHKPGGQLGVEAVEAEDDQPVDRGWAVLLLPPQGPQQQPEWQREDEEEDHHYRPEDEDEGTEEGEPRPGADIRLGGGGNNQTQDNGRYNDQ